MLEPLSGDAGLEPGAAVAGPQRKVADTRHARLRWRRRTVSELTVAEGVVSHEGRGEQLDRGEVKRRTDGGGYDPVIDRLKGQPACVRERHTGVVRKKATTGESWLGVPVPGSRAGG